HVVNFPLVPIRRAPHAGNRRQLALFLADVRLESQMTMMAVAVEMVNDREARILAVVVDAGDVDEVVAAERLFGEGAHLDDPPGVRELQRDLAAELHGFGDEIVEPGFELLGKFESGHGKRELKPRMNTDEHGSENVLCCRSNPCSSVFIRG